MKTKLPTTIKPACSALDEGENQNPLRLPWKSIGREFDGFGIVNCESGLVVECLTLNKMQRDAILNGVNEHAALSLVADAAKKYFDNPQDVDAFEWLEQRLQELAAVRGEKVLVMPEIRGRRGCMAGDELNL